MRSFRAEHTLTKNPIGRELLSWSVTVGSLGMCLIYVWPVPLARRSLDSSTVNVVRFLEECFVVVWPLLFGGAAITLAYTLIRGRGMEWGHLAALVAWAAFAAAVLCGALFSGGPIVTGWIALIVGAINYSLIVSYTHTVVIRGADGGR